MSGERAQTIEHSLKRYGYRDALCYAGNHYWGHWPERPDEECRLKRHLPWTMQPYHRYRRYGRTGYGWFPDLHVLKRVVPAVAKNNEGVLTDSSGIVRVFEELPTWKFVESIMREMTSERLRNFNETMRPAPMWFERWIDIALSNNTPVEWRMFCYAGNIIQLAPKSPCQGSPIPPPPQELLSAAARDGSFKAVDFALDTRGKWWVLKIAPGSQPSIPAGGSAQEFYQGLAKALEASDKLPEWCWSLVADVVDVHAIGESKTLVGGSRHFAAGTKVHLVDDYWLWDISGPRCTVLGVPKYSDYPVGVIMRLDHLVNFRLERVTDAAIIKALITNRLREPFERSRRTSLGGRWSNTDEDRDDILELVAMLNDRAQD